MFLLETRIIRRGWSGSPAPKCPASASLLRWERFSVIGAVGCQAKKGAHHTINMGLSHEWRGKKVFLMHGPYSRCDRKQSPPSLQALAEKRVVTSVLANSSLVPLCILATSQVGH